MMEKEYTYYAFISYNHLDEKWARSLQYKLHHYRLPSVARKEVGEDVRIRPVFRYVTNLSLGDLRENLNKELEESKYLIVICSPNSAQPNIRGGHWVNDEIKRFIALGRKNRIVPVIIAGKPYSGDVATECFPPALRTADIAGADLSTGSRAERRYSFLKIVAKLLDLKPDQLIRLTEREDRRRRIIKWLSFVPLLLIGVLGGCFLLDSNRTVCNYYADYVDSFGLPEGIFKLKKSELEHHQVHYRFEYRGFQFGNSPHADSANWCFWNLLGLRRRLVRVLQANSYGSPIKREREYAERPLVQDFGYDENSCLCEIRYWRFNDDGGGLSLEKRIELSNLSKEDCEILNENCVNDQGVTNGLLEFYASNGRIGVAYDIASTKNDREFSFKAEISKHIVMRDGKGRVTRLLFLNNDRRNVPNADGLYGFSYEYDDCGRQTAQWYLFRKGSDFERRADKDGVAGRKYEYSIRNLQKVEYVDPKNQLIIGPNGWMVRRDDFDEFDNIITSWFEDEKGKKNLCRDGYVCCKYEYDGRGNMTKKAYLGADGEFALTRDGYAEVRMEYEQGNVTRMSYFGTNGKPVLHKDGYAEVRMEYVHGNMTKKAYLGVDGKPSLINDGYTEIRMEYKQGNVTRISYFGVDGQRVLHKEGYAEVRMEYEHGNMTRMSYFGTDGKPALHKGGYSEVHMEYEHGNMTKVSLFGVDGKSVLHEDGYAEVRMEYEHGNMTKKTYFGVDGKPVRHKDGYAEVRSEYEHGNMTKVSLFDVGEKPTLSIGGFAELYRTYDTYGNMIGELYLGTDGKPTQSKRGFAEWRSEYDEHGNMMKKIYLGVDGKPTLTKDGYAEVRREYDACGNLMREEYFDVDGNPTQKKCGVHPLAYLVDVCGAVVILRNCKKYEVRSSCELLNSGDELNFSGDAKGKVIYEDAFYNVSGPMRYRIALPAPLRIEALSGKGSPIEPQFTTRGAHLGLWGESFVVAPATMQAQVIPPVIRANDAEVVVCSPRGSCYNASLMISITGDPKVKYRVSALDMERAAVGKTIELYGSSHVSAETLFDSPPEEESVYSIKVIRDGKTVNEVTSSTFWLVGGEDRKKITHELQPIESFASEIAKDFFTANVLYSNGCYSEAYLLARKLHDAENGNMLYANLLKLCSKALNLGSGGKIE